MRECEKTKEKGKAEQTQIITAHETSARQEQLQQQHYVRRAGNISNTGNMLLRRLQHSGSNSNSNKSSPVRAPSSSNPTLIGFTRQPTTTTTIRRAWLLPLLCLAIVAHVSAEIGKCPISIKKNKKKILILSRENGGVAVTVQCTIRNSFKAENSINVIMRGQGVTALFWGCNYGKCN